MKNLTVYVLSADDDKVSTDAYTIQEWSEIEDAGGKMPKEAFEFMQRAASLGNAYSVSDFLLAYNLEETVGMNDWVFISKVNIAEEVESYWQPDLSHSDVIAANFPSFGVFGTQKEAETAFPNVPLQLYFGDDIENPTYFDGDLNAL